MNAGAADGPPDWACPDPSLPIRLRPCVYGVAIDAAGRVCVARESGGQHFLPGGGVERGEDEATALLREIREELGLGARLLDRLGEGSEWLGGAAPGRWLHKRAAFWRVALGDPLPGLAGEHELRWLPPDEALEALAYVCHRWAVTEALRGSPPRAQMP